MKTKRMNLGRRFAAIGMSLVMAGSSIVSGFTSTAQAAPNPIKFDTKQFVTQAMTH